MIDRQIRDKDTGIRIYRSSRYIDRYEMSDKMIEDMNIQTEDSYIVSRGN